jgi:hypothetical protein
MNHKLVELVNQLINFDFTFDSYQSEPSQVSFDKSAFNNNLSGKITATSTKKLIEFIGILLSIFDAFPDHHEAASAIFDDYKDTNSKYYFILSADQKRLGYWNGKHGRFGNPNSVGTESDEGQLLFSLILPNDNRIPCFGEDEIVKLMERNPLVKSIIDQGYHNFSIHPHLFGDVSILVKS